MHLSIASPTPTWPLYGKMVGDLLGFVCPMCWGNNGDFSPTLYTYFKPKERRQHN